MAADRSDSAPAVAIETRKGWLWVMFPDGLSVHDYLNVVAAITSRIRRPDEEVVVDLSRVRALYSSGLGILARIHARLAKNGGKIHLVNVSRPIKELLSSVHLDKVFAVHATDVEFEIMHDKEKTGEGSGRARPPWPAEQCNAP